MEFLTTFKVTRDHLAREFPPPFRMKSNPSVVYACELEATSFLWQRFIHAAAPGLNSA